MYKQYEKYLSITGMVDTEKLEELEQKAKLLEQNSNTNQGVITALLENGKNKDAQVNNMTTAGSSTREPKQNQRRNEFPPNRRYCKI
jgi:hypothetical protein